VDALHTDRRGFGFLPDIDIDMTVNEIAVCDADGKNWPHGTTTRIKVKNPDSPATIRARDHFARRGNDPTSLPAALDRG
jgi:hypothetical protein